jgi:hypothetical protein
MNNEELVKLAACAGWPVCPGAAHLLARPGNPQWLVAFPDSPSDGLTHRTTACPDESRRSGAVLESNWLLDFMRSAPEAVGIVIGSITNNLMMHAADEQEQSLVPTVRRHNGG